MAPNTFHNFPFNSENLFEVSDSSDPNVNFFNSVPKKTT